MKRKPFKRLTALILTVVIANSVVACSYNSNNPINSTKADEIKELSIVLSSHPSWPYKGNWPIWDWVEETTGLKLNIQAIPSEDYSTKIPLLLASPEMLPDIMYMEGAGEVSKHGMSGAFVPISDNLNKMPNYTAFMNTLPETERKELEGQRTAGDGKMYFPPVYGTQTVMNLRTWMYRKDIFEKNNLQPPTTETELYNVAKKLKALYPESYPLCFRTGLEQITVMGPMWKNNFAWNLYYDFKQKKWCWGAQDSETMLHIINYFKKMQAEGLVPPDFLTINVKSWEELVSTDRAFMMPEYLVRIDFFNKIKRQENSKYTWAAMAPPKGDNESGQSKIAKLNLDPSGYVICNTRDEARINKSLWFIDWMYTDKATDLLSWGKEGTSYTTDTNGKRTFIVDESKGQTVSEKYGIGTSGTYLRTTSYEEAYSEEQRKQGKQAYGYTEENANPFLWLPLNSEEQAIFNETYNAVLNYTEEQLSKFILNQLPMSEWDTFQKDLKAMGVDRLLEIYTTAYNRVMGK